MRLGIEATWSMGGPGEGRGSAPAVGVARTAKWAFTTRRADRAGAAGLSRDLGAARPGDLVLARVEAVGSHRNLQLAAGRPSELHLGDLIVAACGARYAADQFEGTAELDPAGSDLLAGGGVIGRMRSRHGKISAPTRVAPLGRLIDADGTVLNLDRWALPPRRRPEALPTICVVGAGMNSGKTAAAAGLVHGLSRAGLRVAGIKATGTGSYGDVHAYLDAGAAEALDFTDAGMASTFGEPTPRLLAALDTLLAEAAARGCDVAVAEIADGLLQRETAALLASAELRAAMSGWLYAAPDALSAVGGAATLALSGIAPAALTGLVARSPLATAEAEAATGLRVLGRDALRDPGAAVALLNEVVAAGTATEAAPGGAVRAA